MAWLAAHPVIQGVLWSLVVVLVGALFNWVSYKRTPEEWAAFDKASPRLAKFVRVMRILFPHLRKIPALAPFIPPADDDQPKPPTPPIVAVMLLALAVLLTGCPKTPNTPREMARGYLAVMGMATQASVHACTEAAKAMKAAENPDWKPLATECADAYDIARTALFGVEAALDTWEEADARRLACAAGTALEGIERISRAMSTRTIPLDPKTKAQVEDGVRMAGYLLKTYGGTCAAAKDGGV